MHGFADHIGRYEMVAQELNKRGFSCAGVDIEGHGESRGARAYLPSFKNALTDLQSFVQHAREEVKLEDGQPLYLLGHSMGGTFVLAVAHAMQLAGNAPSGLMLTAPMVDVDPAVATPTLRFIQGILKNIVPGLVVQHLDPSFMSTLDAVKDDYQEDRLGCSGDVYMGSATQLLGLMDHVKSVVPKITVPIIAMHSKADKLTSSDATENMVKDYGTDAEGTGAASGGGKSGSASSEVQKKFVMVTDGSAHELLFDAHGLTHMSALCDWAEEQTGKGK